MREIMRKAAFRASVLLAITLAFDVGPLHDGCPRQQLPGNRPPVNGSARRGAEGA